MVFSHQPIHGNHFATLSPLAIILGIWSSSCLFIHIYPQKNVTNRKTQRVNKLVHNRKVLASGNNPINSILLSLFYYNHSKWDMIAYGGPCVFSNRFSFPCFFPFHFLSSSPSLFPSFFLIFFFHEYRVLSESTFRQAHTHILTTPNFAAQLLTLFLLGLVRYHSILGEVWNVFLFTICWCMRLTSIELI